MSMMMSVVFCGVTSPSNGQAYGVEGIVGIASLRGVVEPLAIAPVRFRKAAGGAVDVAHLVLPRQPIFAGDKVLHESVGAIPGAAGDRGEAAMTELVDVVLDRTMGARRAHEVGARFGGDDLVRAAAGAVGEDSAVEIDD